MLVMMGNYFDLCIYIFIVYIIFVTSLASNTSYHVDKRPELLYIYLKTYIYLTVLLRTILLSS